MGAPEAAMRALVDLMARLRDPDAGCPWDRAQTFATIAPYTIEEAYEVREAIVRGNPGELRDELGDLLFQVVFHARMAEEAGWFDLADVAQSIREKLIRRHPHVFEAAAETQDPARLARSWEEHKALERRAEQARDGHATSGVLKDVPASLPALMRAAKLGRRAAHVGFDWNTADAVLDKVREELGELGAARAAPDSTGPSGAVAEELGDLLFAMANLGRHLGVDPEEALRVANGKFERRFARMEALAEARKLRLQDLSPEDWDRLWCEVKAEERACGQRA